MNAMVSTHGCSCGRRLLCVTAIIQGESRLVLGRPKPSGGEESTGGVEVDVSCGDVVVVPAGVSHRSLTSSGGYRYIGVYPEVSSQHDCNNTALMAFRLVRSGATTTARAKNPSTTWRRRLLTSVSRTWILSTASMGRWSRSGRLLLVKVEATLHFTIHLIACHFRFRASSIDRSLSNVSERSTINDNNCTEHYDLPEFRWPNYVPLTAWPRSASHPIKFSTTPPSP
jgi:hypothetical protein